jgi:ribosomal protein S18 acetylase RimI-like enzyme
MKNKTPPITIRRAGPDDVTAIARLFCDVQSLHAAHHPEKFKQPAGDEAESEWLAGIFRGPTACVWLAEAGDEIVGYLFAQEVRREASVIRPQLHYYLLEHIGVAPEHRKRGVGAALMRTLFHEAAIRQIDRIELDVWQFNEEARKFFARHGFATQQERMEAVLTNGGIGSL